LVVIGLGIAQAAAILVGAMLLFPSPTVAVAKAEVDIDYGRIDLIRFDPRGVDVVCKEPEENSNSVDSGFVALGYFEAMAE